MRNNNAYLGFISARITKPVVPPTNGPKVGNRFVIPTITEINATNGILKIIIKTAFDIPTIRASSNVQDIYLRRIVLHLVKKPTKS